MKYLTSLIHILIPVLLVAQVSNDTIAYNIGMALETSFQEGDPSFLKNHFDQEGFLAQFLIEDENNKELTNFNSGLRETSVGEVFASGIINSINLGSDYNFINFYSDGLGNYYLIFRYLGDDGINYHEYYLEIINKKEFAFKDVYVYTTGEFLVESMTNLYLMSLSNFDEYSTSAGLEIDEIIALGEVNQLLQQGKLEEARKVFNEKIPEKTKDSRYGLLYQLRLVDIMDEENYLSLLEKLQEIEKSRTALYMTSLDIFYMSGEYEKCLEVVDSLYAMTQDDFLDLYRGNIYFEKGIMDTAHYYYKNLAQNYPYLPDGYDALLSFYEYQNQIDSFVLVLDRLEYNMELDFSEIHDLVTDYYPTVVENEFYTKWSDKKGADLKREPVDVAEWENLPEFQRKLNEDYADPEKSPLKAKDRENFTGLDFFEYNDKFSIRAEFIRTEDAVPFKMMTTTDRKPEYVQYGIAKFQLDGKFFQLNIFRNIELSKKEEYKDYLFLPFTDETNGVETYGGGRYINLTIPDKENPNSIVIDFNEAYNPYCAYNDIYSCPIPPADNHLRIEIRAGVKAFHK